MAIIDKAKDQKLVNLCDWSSHQCLRNKYLLDRVLKFFLGSSHRGSVEMNLTSICEDAGSIPGLY